MESGVKRRLSAMVRGILLPALIILVLVVFFTGISNLHGDSGAEEKRQLEESIRRVAAACYAAEGIYPPDVAYMKEHYGLQIDEDRYYVDYQVFASNLMPDFTVLEIKTETGTAEAGE